ncbi:hypothetical protein [Nocardia aurea]|uniref:hypothetical protein n=1 Tax=Nocardia aurea TaxID=2144174 RepID=UPI0033A4B899
MALPLGAIEDAIEHTESLFAALGPGTVSTAAPAVLQALRVLVIRLAQLDTVYCGLGRHVSASGEQISSTLTVSLHEYGEPRNPRLTLGDVLQGRCAAGEMFENAEFVDVAGRVVLLLDHVRAAPTPELPGYDTSDTDTEQAVYQLEAVVPAPDGSAIAVIEFSTPFTDHGEEFLSTMLIMVASLEFVLGPQPSMTPFSLDL